MIQDTDKDILDKYDRIAKLEENLKEAIRLWTCYDKVSDEKNRFAIRRFYITPIASSKGQTTRCTAMNITQDRTSPDRSFEKMLENLIPFTDQYDIEFV